MIENIEQKRTIAEEFSNRGLASQGKKVETKNIIRTLQESKTDHSHGLGVHQGIIHGVGYVFAIGSVVGFFMSMGSVVCLVSGHTVGHAVSHFHSLVCQMTQFVSRF